MAINYCDWLNGDDDTGTGTAVLPYKSIERASSNLIGEDDVRVAKSPNNTDLIGTLSFSNGSASIITSEDLTGVLSPGDFVGKATETDSWWEVISLNVNTLSLFKKYSGITETVASRKLGTIDVEMLFSNNSFQEILSSGTSALEKLNISGGWNLASETQTGETNFKQMNAIFDNRMGNGLFINRKNYLEIEKLGFLRFTNGIEISISDYLDFTSVICHSNDRYGIMSTDEDSKYLNFTSCDCNQNTLFGMYFYYLYHSGFYSCKCHSNTEHGIQINSGINLTIDDFIANNNLHGINIQYTSNCEIDNIICNYNTEYGLTLNHDYNFILYNIICSNNNRGFDLNLNNDIVMNSIVCNDNVNGVNLDRESGVIMDNYLSTGNTVDINTLEGQQYTDAPVLRTQHFQTTGDNRCYYEYGVTYRNILEAQSTQCLQFAPTSDIYYIKQKFCFVSEQGDQKTISFYIKDDIDFDGDVQAALYFMGKKITGWSDIVPITNYVKHSIIAQVSDITEDGVIELHIKVRGTLGNVYLDDLGVL